MHKIRIIPTLLFNNTNLVKGSEFNNWRIVGTALPAIKVYNRREVDELIFVDITASSQNRKIDHAEIDVLADDCFMPLTVGGGINSINDVNLLLRAGADKVTLNTAAIENPMLITEIAKSFGSQCLVVSIDVKKLSDGSYKVFSYSSAKETNLNPINWAKEAERLGAGEILLTSINLDGTMKGYDLELIKSVTSEVSIPVIASGGAGTYEHMYEAITIGNASAVAAASMFHFTESTPLEAKKYLHEKGIPVRL